MPNETYQPKTFRHSKHHRARWMRRFWNILGIILVYVLITRSLDRLDNTPRWAHVSFPPFAVQCAPYEVDVRYCKQLDVQLLLADIGRAFTKHQGWYGQRTSAISCNSPAFYNAIDLPSVGR